MNSNRAYRGSDIRGDGWISRRARTDPIWPEWHVSSCFPQQSLHLAQSLHSRSKRFIWDGNKQISCHNKILVSSRGRLDRGSKRSSLAVKLLVCARFLALAHTCRSQETRTKTIRQKHAFISHVLTSFTGACPKWPKYCGWDFKSVC